MGLILSMMAEKLFGPIQSRIAMLGLDAAGKTTILYKLKLNDVVTTIPTIGFNVETINFHHLTMTVWDVGGQKAVRYKNKTMHKNDTFLDKKCNILKGTKIFVYLVFCLSLLRIVYDRTI